MSDKRSSPGPGRPKDPAKRIAILEAAQTLFLQHGYDGCSMDAIAAEAGVSKLTVYSHFSDKETLFAAAVVGKCQEMLPESLFVLPVERNLETMLLKIARGFYRLINSRESVELHRTIFSMARHETKLAQMFYEAGPKRALKEMTSLLHQADRAGKLRIPQANRAAEHFFDLVKGHAHFCLLIGCGAVPTDEEAEAHVQEVVALFLRAYRV